MPWVKSGDLNDSIVYSTSEFISEEGLASSAARILPQGTVLVAMYGATVGKTAILGIPAATNQAVCSIQPARGQFNPPFLQFLLMHLRPSLLRERYGGAQPNISQTIIRALKLPQPEISEQQKIAAVLWKLQRAIVTQDRLLAATADLKQSAMQRLFTHGLEGEPLKDTEIGPMPESWGVQQVRDIASLRGGKRLPKGVPLATSPTPYPYIRVTDFRENSVDTSGIRYVPADVHPQIARYIITTNDVYISIAGSTGLVGMIPSELNGANLTENAARILTGDHIRPDFLMRFLASKAGQLQIRSNTSKNAQPKLALTRIESLLVPVPIDMEEQRAIATTLATIDKKLAHHRAKRAALHDLFETLLHKLMTAEIRVANLDIDTAEITDHLVDANKMIRGTHKGRRH